MRHIRTTLAAIVTVATVAAVAVFAMAGRGLAQQQKAAARISTADYAEIQRLLYTNHTGYDFARKDNADMWTDTFLPDAVLDNPPTHLEGHAQIRAYALAPLKLDPKRELRHWTSTFHVEPHPEGAILSAFYVTMTQSQGRPGMVFGMSTGRYESVVVKTADGWRIKHHVVIGEGPVSMYTPPASAP
jgi:hypothetical protein